MSELTRKDVDEIAVLARLDLSDDEKDRLRGELSAILGHMATLAELTTDGVEPMTSVVHMDMKKRADEVTDGGKADDILANAPAGEDGFFMVPKVVE